jgi:drug/metabolite transporter (DMT)-like permease
MSTLPPTSARAATLALVVTVLWSSSWVFIRWGLDGADLQPLTFAAMRYATAALVLLGWVLSRRHLRAEVTRIGGRMWVRVVVLGLLFYAVTQGSQFVAIDTQPAATTSLVLSWTPLVVAVAANKSISENASLRQVIGGITVVAGAAFYFAGDLGATLVGMAAAIISLLANVSATLLGRSVNRDKAVSPVVLTAASMGVGAFFLLSVGVAFEGVPELSVRGWAIVLWLAMVNTALAFTLWNVALRTISAVEAAAINNTMLVQIALLGWLLLDEPLGPQEIVGIVLVSAGILLAQTFSIPTSHRFRSSARGRRGSDGPTERIRSRRAG